MPLRQRAQVGYHPRYHGTTSNFLPVHIKELRASDNLSLLYLIFGQHISTSGSSSSPLQLLCSANTHTYILPNTTQAIYLIRLLLELLPLITFIPLLQFDLIVYCFKFFFRKFCRIYLQPHSPLPLYSQCRYFTLDKTLLLLLPTTYYIFPAPSASPDSQ